MWIIIILVVAIILGKFFYDKNQLTNKTIKEGGMKNKYHVLIDCLMEGEPRGKILNETKDSITFGISNIGGATLFKLTQGFGKVIVQWEVNTPVYGKHNMKWEFLEYDDQENIAKRIVNDTGKYQQNIMNTFEVGDPQKDNPRLLKPQKKIFICDKCSTAFLVDISRDYPQKSDHMLDLMPVGDSKFKDNFVKSLLVLDSSCQHSLELVKNTPVGYAIVNFDQFLKEQAKKMTEEFYIQRNEYLADYHKKASLYYLYASWFTNDSESRDFYYDAAWGMYLQYTGQKISYNSISQDDQEIIYDLIFLNLSRKLGEFKFCISNAKLICNKIINIYSDNYEEFNAVDYKEFNTVDIPVLLKIIEAQIKLASNEDTNDYTLDQIDVRHIDLFVLIHNFFLDIDK